MKLIVCCTVLISAYSSQISAKGDNPSYSELTTNSGVTYHSVRVMSIAPDGIVVMHRDGGCRIDVKELPQPTRKDLKIDTGEAAEKFRSQRKSAQKAQRERLILKLKNLSLEKSNAHSSPR